MRKESIMDRILGIYREFLGRFTLQAGVGSRVLGKKKSLNVLKSI
jgi:hypothetical protein